MKVSEIKYELDGTYMNVISFGEGPKTFIMLSGISLCGLEGMGEAVAQAYASLADDYTFYLFDRKKVLPEGYTVRDITNDIYRVTQMIGIEKADVFGVSQGGMIGQCLAADHPELVNKLVLCSTYAKPGKKMERAGERWITHSAAHDVEALNYSFFELVYSEAFLKAAEAALPAAAKVGTAEDCDRFKVLVEACLSFDFIDELEKIKCPAYVIADEQDKVIEADCGRFIAEKLGCEIYVYNQFGHAVYDEAPDFKERLKKILAE